MNRTLISVIIVVAVMLQIGSALSAGPFDGKWKGRLKFEGSCRPSDVTVDVTEMKASGYLENSRVKVPITGNIADDGSFQGTYGSKPLIGKFAGDTFDGTTDSYDCGHALLELKRTN